MTTNQTPDSTKPPEREELIEQALESAKRYASAQIMASKSRAEEGEVEAAWYDLKQSFSAAMLHDDGNGPFADFKKEGWRKECGDTDSLLEHLGLDPSLCRTDGGWLNLPRIKALLAADGKAGGEVALRQENELLRTALRFYARGDNYHLDESEEFDTVSGEPQNWLCSGVEDSETMIENGEVARHTLMGHVIGWEDAEEDHTPQPIAGEAPFSAAALQTAYNTRPQQAARVPDELEPWDIEELTALVNRKSITARESCSVFRAVRFINAVQSQAAQVLRAEASASHAHDRHLCLMCKRSGIPPFKHGTLDDHVTPCPNREKP